MWLPLRLSVRTFFNFLSALGAIVSATQHENKDICSILALHSAKEGSKVMRVGRDTFGDPFIQKWSIFTKSKMDHQLLCQKVNQRISVMKTNTLYVSKEFAF